MDTPILEYVLAELQARKGSWIALAKELEPDSWASYYSWLTKLAQDRIPDPSVNKIQRLADYFRANERTPPEQLPHPASNDSAIVKRA